VVTLPFEFANPLPEQAEMKVRPHGLRPGWTLTVAPYRFSLAPGERIEGEAILQAEDTVPFEDAEEEYQAPIVSLEALILTGCTWEPVGGFSMIAHTVRKASLDVNIDPDGTGVHVSTHATAQDGPIANANVAIRLTGRGQLTSPVTRATTDAQGHAYQFVAANWNGYPLDSPLAVEVRLSPTKGTGPAKAVVPVTR